MSSRGNYVKMIRDLSEVGIEDLNNPWTFYNLFLQEDDLVVEWLQKNNFIATSLNCKKSNCDGICYLKKRKGGILGHTFRCNKNRNHEYAIRTNSFFENSKFPVQDIFQFIRSYLEESSLYHTSLAAGMSYKNTAVQWGVFVREICSEYIWNKFYKNPMKLRGQIQIDESLFGRKVKYHTGNPNVGLRIWIFGMVEVDSNKLVLYPVKDRSKNTLLPLIEKHVEKGSTIYSDSWAAYFNLNDLGYSHFTVIHKKSFKQIYKKIETGEEVEVHTNQIEGSWKHMKDHFRKMNGKVLHIYLTNKFLL